LFKKNFQNDRKIKKIKKIKQNYSKKHDILELKQEIIDIW